MRIIIASLLILATWSCKKDTEELPDTVDLTSNCAVNSGDFNITIGGDYYELVLNTDSQFSILYNWFGEEKSSFVINSIDQNNAQIFIELSLPGKFNVGTTSYSDSLTDFFDIDVGSHEYYVSEVTFIVTESNLSSQDGVYKPVVSTYSGTAHSYPWSSTQPPVDTLSFSGSFCLNGYILP